MPLDRSGSKASVGNNIRTEKLEHPEMKQSQAVAIALDVARRSKRAAGGASLQQPWYIRHAAQNEVQPMRSSAISPPTLPKMAVPAITGNLASTTPLGKALASSPKVSGSKVSFPKPPSPPKLPKMKRGGEVEGRGKLLSQGPLLGSTPGRADKVDAQVEDGAYIIPADCVSACGQNSSLAGHAAIERMLSKLPKVKSTSKAPQNTTKPVPVALSDGEHIISRDSVERIGSGDYEKGRRVLDQFVLHVRRKQIHDLSKLPPPAKDDE